MSEAPAPIESTVRRIEVRTKAAHGDPRGAAAQRDASETGVTPVPRRVDHTAVYLIQSSLQDEQIQRLARELLADPVTEEAFIGASEPRGDALIEVHPLPGVMDPDAEAVEIAVRAMFGVDVDVRTGRRFDLYGTDVASARLIAERSLANPVVQAVHNEPYYPTEFPAGTPTEAKTTEVELLGLDDEQLQKLSREAHLFLSLEEMKAIQAEYERAERNPKDIELETLAQTWSEHCVHKTLKATIRYRETGAADDQRIPDVAHRPGHETHLDGSVTIHNLLKCTVAAATSELMADGIDWCLSVFVDNAGVIAFDDETAVCFKVETHNHPSAIEPYGGAATGIGGVIRDIMGTGLAAKPIAGTDVFCVAHPEGWTRRADNTDAKLLPAGCLHPRRILRQIVAGVRDYGNRMGIPTLNGAVWFDDDYVGNPLVYAGCVGVMPRDMVTGDPRPGDRIIVLGGATGRDGIHGATFSSAELTDTHADEFSHAVQIGNPVTEKKTLDVILAARDHESGCLYSAITDCGAGGYSSSVGEMGEKIGAEVQLDRAPLKYEGLTPTEIWISEAQERMTLAVSEENIAPLQALCDLHDVTMCDLGVFGTDDRELILRYGDLEVGRLSMELLHEGVPDTTREAEWTAPPVEVNDAAPAEGETTLRCSVTDTLIGLLAHRNIASKRWVVRQYDHEVQGGSVIKPLVGVDGDGPGDAAVIRPVADSTRGLAIANGLATGMKDDPYLMTLAAIDECMRNLVCVGTDPTQVAILDNFCWPGCDDPQRLGELVRAAEACYDGAKAYRTPFISGKDSLNNQFTGEDGVTIRIPPTLLISGFGIVPDVRKCVTMDAKDDGDLLLMVGLTDDAMGGSHYLMVTDDRAASRRLPRVDLTQGPKKARAVHQAIAHGLVRAAHDCSEGGMLVAAAEMAMAGGRGLHLDLLELPVMGDLSREAECFAETPSRYLLQVKRSDLPSLDEWLTDVPYAIIGTFNDSTVLSVMGGEVEVDLAELSAAFTGALDW